MAKRREKRLRLMRQGPTTPTSPQAQLYFNTISRDVITVIIQHVSKRPHVADWQAYADCRDVLKILRCGGLLAEEARAMFIELTYGEYWGSVHVFERKRPSLQACRGADFSQLLIELGPQVRSLFATGSQPFLSDFYFENCSHLRELTIKYLTSEGVTFTLSKILKSCGDSLTHLCLLGSGQMKPAHLELIIRHCRVLESLWFEDRMVSGKIEEFWKVVGRTLKRLKCRSLIPPYSTYGALNCVQRHCKLLEDVEFTWYPLRLPVLHFYKTLGTRLKILRFDYFAPIPTPQVMGEILNKCPNVVVDFTECVHTEGVLRVLGERVRKLELGSILNPSAEFTSIANALTGLSELELCEQDLKFSLKFVKALFNAPKPNLTKLYIPCVNVFEQQGNTLVDSMNVLDIIARTVQSLREFKCRSFNTIELASFEAVLQSNRDLRRIGINYFQRDADGLNPECRFNCIGLIRSLVKYRSVVDFYVDFKVLMPHWKIESNEIRNACVPLRSRQLNLTVDYHQYLPSFRKHIY